ncbi:Uncharacterised protein [Mycobacterium tuberculosis]|nr:Uncharacterised protein [Mycobacterium tuberculosis]
MRNSCVYATSPLAPVSSGVMHCCPFAWADRKRCPARSGSWWFAATSRLCALSVGMPAGL